MPNFDRTGPQGSGAMTGRAAGLCGTNAGKTPGFRQMPGRRGGAGRGRGRGFGRSQTVEPALESVETDAPLSDEDKRRALKTERNRLKAMLREVEGKLQGQDPSQDSKTDETG
jgi:uncharacterized protein DUF5320